LYRAANDTAKIHTVLSPKRAKLNKNISSIIL
jgi:hypothetical protein